MAGGKMPPLAKMPSLAKLPMTGKTPSLNTSLDVSMGSVERELCEAGSAAAAPHAAAHAASMPRASSYLSVQALGAV